MSRCLFDGIRGVLCEGDVVEENCRFFVGDCRTYRKEKTCFVKSMENHIVLHVCFSLFSGELYSEFYWYNSRQKIDFNVQIAMNDCIK